MKNKIFFMVLLVFLCNQLLSQMQAQGVQKEVTVLLTSTFKQMGISPKTENSFLTSQGLWVFKKAQSGEQGESNLGDIDFYLPMKNTTISGTIDSSGSVIFVSFTSRLESGGTEYGFIDFRDNLALYFLQRDVGDYEEEAQRHRCGYVDLPRPCKIFVLQESSAAKKVMADLWEVLKNFPQPISQEVRLPGG